jgi:hypothetical protein
VPTWDDFFIAQMGASAALTGLLFVGLSINMQKIVSFPSLPDRALNAFVLLGAILLISLLFLVPGQSAGALAVEVLVTGGAIAFVAVRASGRSLRQTPEPYRAFHALETGVVATATLCYPLSGVLLLTDPTFGAYPVVAAVMLSFIIALIDSWVLLIEINR